MDDRPPVRVVVPATAANLGAGFDALGLALDLTNAFTFSIRPEGPLIEITGEGAGSLPRDPSHLAYAAAQEAFRRAAGDAPPMALHQENRIPLAGGLGGSATAIVAGVLAGLHLAKATWKTRAILDLAAELEGHPDNVAPALLGGLVVTVQTGGGGFLGVPLPAPENLAAVLAIPDVRVNTADARAVLDGRVSREDAVFNVGRSALTVAAFLQKRLEWLKEAMQDRLHEPQRAALVPGFHEIKKAALEAGAYGACLSGAGPTVLALAPDQSAREVGEAMAEACEGTGVSCRIRYTVPANRGALVLGGPHAIPPTPRD